MDAADGVATPSTAPISRLVLAADAAIPERSGGTADSAAEVIGTTVAPTPMPVTASAAASCAKRGLGLMVTAVSSRPAPNTAQPVTTDQRDPAVTVHRPASTEVRVISAVIGRKISAIW